MQPFYSVIGLGLDDGTSELRVIWALMDPPSPKGRPIIHIVDSELSVTRVRERRVGKYLLSKIICFKASDLGIPPKPTRETGRCVIQGNICLRERSCSKYGGHTALCGYYF